MNLYRAIAGDLYEAVIVGDRPDGSHDVEVVIPGTSSRLRLTRCLMDSDGILRKEPSAWAKQPQQNESQSTFPSRRRPNGR